MKRIITSALLSLTVACGLLGFAACGGNTSGRKTSATDPIVGSWVNEIITDEYIMQTLYQIEYQESNSSRYYITVCTLKYDRGEDADYDTPTRSTVTERKASVFVQKNDLYDFNVGENKWVNIPDGQYEYRGPLFAPVDRDTTWFLVLGDDATTFTPHTGKIPSGATANYKNAGAGAGAVAGDTPSGYSFKKISGMSLEKFKSQTQRRDISGNKMWERDSATGFYADENGKPLADQQDKSKWLPIWSWQNYTGRN